MRDVKIVLGETNNGPMLYIPTDAYVGRSLDLYGEFSAGEQSLFDFVSQRGGAAIDVGANMGAHTMAMAKRYEHVFAFEPQKTLHKLLCGNLSPFLNTTIYNAAVSNDESVIHFPDMDYSVPNNFGALGKACFDDLPAEERATINMTPVQVRVIDKCEAIQASEKISLIKVDVEGMEREVLEGARQTIAKHQPILYVENDKPKHSQALLDYIYNTLAYRAWWHITNLYNPANFKQNSMNVYPEIVSFNIICVPEGHWVDIQGAQACTPQKPFVPEGCVT